MLLTICLCDLYFPVCTYTITWCLVFLSDTYVLRSIDFRKIHDWLRSCVNPPHRTYLHRILTPTLPTSNLYQHQHQRQQHQIQPTTTKNIKKVHHPVYLRVCVVHIKPFFYPSTSSTPSVRADSSP
ncbi:unnamed protein product [Laminaria digitata]